MRSIFRSAEGPARWVVTAAVLAGLSACGSDESRVSSDPIDWLASQAIHVASVDPEQRDFADLQPLKDVIGDSRVVLLGEQTHGDGTVFLAKTRLIEFLHQEMGFDVLAFESGLFDMRNAWRAMIAGQDPLESFASGVFGVWAGSAEVEPLVAYLAEVAPTDRPLELAGFDSQFSDWMEENFLQELEAFLRAAESPLLADGRWVGVRRTLPGLLDGSQRSEKPPEDERAEFREVMAELREWLGGDQAPRSERSFWSQMLKSAMAQAEGMWAMDQANYSPDMANPRDEQMADNLLWLADHLYQGRKIIVWAATAHNVRNIREIEIDSDLDYSQAVTMGERVWEALGDDVYSLGFTAYEGEAARWMFDSTMVTVLAVPTEGSLEDLMGRAGLENAIVDFRTAGPALDWLSARMIARPMGYVEEVADWTSQFDGMFFNRVMERSTPGVMGCRQRPVVCQ